ANFPAEFMAANLSNEIDSQDKDKLSECISEARKMGLEIIPPEINRSGKLFSVVDGKIIYGLLGIKGLGDTTANEIVNKRLEKPYRNFMDFLERVDFKLAGKSIADKLIQTGAFDRFGIKRENLAGNLERAIDYVQKSKEDRQYGQTSLFGDSSVELPEFRFEDFPEMSRADRLTMEKQLIGLYLSGHPLDEYKKIWEKNVKVNLGDPEHLPEGNHILVGMITALKTITGKGGEMAFASLADYNGEIEVTFFPRVWENCRNYIAVDKAVILRGKIDYQKEKELRSFIVSDRIDPLKLEAALEEQEALERKWEKFRTAWNYMAELKGGDLEYAKKGAYTVMGFLKKLRKFSDKNGNEMAFGTLQDFEGEIDLVFFSKVWDQCRDLLKPDEFIALRGSIDPENDQGQKKPGFAKKTSFRVSSIADLASLTRTAARKEQAGEKPPRRVRPASANGNNGSSADKRMLLSAAGSDAAAGALHIRLGAGAADRNEELYALRDWLADNTGPCPVFIYIGSPSGEKIIRTAAGVTMPSAGTPELLHANSAIAQIWRD
ncbi:MAG: DNA polymerase III subunit alpha, partial [Treponema sp.]|nr:DNA polymerase III subunit alpha [Treponema sp.]